MSDTYSSAPSAPSAQNPRDLRETPSPHDQLAAIGKLSVKLEDSFLTLGQLLSEIKRAKLFRLKGYESLKAYLEGEHHFPSALASKLISIYDLFVGELDLDELSIAEIGFERLNLIRPLLKDADWATRDEWITTATNLPLPELRDHIKKHREAQKIDEPQDLKTVFTDQFLERFTTALNCSRKELDFKLALYFQNSDPEIIKRGIKAAQRDFESQLTQSASSAPQSAASAGNPGGPNAQR